LRKRWLVAEVVCAILPFVFISHFFILAWSFEFEPSWSCFRKDSLLGLDILILVDVCFHLILIVLLCIFEQILVTVYLSIFRNFSSWQILWLPLSCLFLSFFFPLCGYIS
jgi:hypothetical protein